MRTNTQTKAATQTKPTLHIWCVFSFALIIGLFLAQGAHSATLNEKQQRFDSMYNQLLANPSDIDLTLQYAELAVDLGDYEAAIPPLERLLITSPTPKLKLEIGILYYLLGSYDMAKNYFNQVKGEQAQPELIKQADDYLRRM